MECYKSVSNINANKYLECKCPERTVGIDNRTRVVRETVSNISTKYFRVVVWSAEYLRYRLPCQHVYAYDTFGRLSLYALWRRIPMVTKWNTAKTHSMNHSTLPATNNSPTYTMRSPGTRQWFGCRPSTRWMSALRKIAFRERGVSRVGFERFYQSPSSRRSRIVIRERLRFVTGVQKYLRAKYRDRAAMTRFIEGSHAYTR